MKLRATLSIVNNVFSVTNISIAVSLLAQTEGSLYKICINTQRNWSLGRMNLLWKKIFFFLIFFPCYEEPENSKRVVTFKGDSMVLSKNYSWHRTHQIWEPTGVVVWSTDCAATSENNAWSLAKLFLKYHLGDSFPLLRPEVAKAIEEKITQSKSRNVKGNRQEKW